MHNTMIVAMGWGGRIHAIKNHGTYNGVNNTSTKLRINPPQRKNVMPQEHNYTTHPQRWILYLLPKALRHAVVHFFLSEKNIDPEN